MTAENFAFDTIKVRGGYDPKQHNQAVSVPIYQTAAFELGTPAHADELFTFSSPGYKYSRVGNPTVDALEKRLVALHGARYAVAVGSGMAAVTYTLFNVAEGGGRILTSPRLYGGTFDSLKKLYPTFGIGIDYAENPDDPASFEKAIVPETRAIFVESISNPNIEVADLEALAKIAHAHGIPLIVDNTLATPYLQNPFEHGADLVVYSATKGLNGHGNAIAGVVLEGGDFDWNSSKFPQFSERWQTLRDPSGYQRNFLETFPKFPFTARVRTNYLAYFGAALGPFDAYLILVGLETLSERISKQVRSAETIVRHLQDHAGVSWVGHPSARGSRYADLAAKYLPKGAGSALSFGFKGTPEQLDRFLSSFRIFGFQVNIGDARSLAVNPPRTTHGELTAQEQRSVGVPPETVRLSIGLEDARDLLEDLDQAFEKAFA